jgi:hypothetical protein
MLRERRGLRHLLQGRLERGFVLVAAEFLEAVELGYAIVG